MAPCGTRSLSNDLGQKTKKEAKETTLKKKKSHRWMTVKRKRKKAKEITLKRKS